VFPKLRYWELSRHIRAGMPWAIRTRQMLPVDLVLKGNESVK
jgi:hypothetical protein